MGRIKSNVMPIRLANSTRRGELPAPPDIDIWLMLPEILPWGRARILARIGVLSRGFSPLCALGSSLRPKSLILKSTDARLC